MSDDPITTDETAADYAVDPNAPKCANLKSSPDVMRNCLIFVDGEDVTADCYGFNAVEGWADTYERGDDGELLIHNSRMASRRINGKVTVKVRDHASELVDRLNDANAAGGIESSSTETGEADSTTDEPEKTDEPETTSETEPKSTAAATKASPRKGRGKAK